MTHSVIMRSFTLIHARDLHVTARYHVFLDFSHHSQKMFLKGLCSAQNSQAGYLLMVKSCLNLRQCCGYFCNGAFLITDPTEVYTWGNNTNFSLGHGNQESRQHPELVDVFARTGVYIKQVR